jgi:hypothetical protein
MNNFLKQAHALGARAALADFGLSQGVQKTAEDMSPLQVGIATGLLPGGTITGPALAAIVSPQDRTLSRLGSTLGGSLAGLVGGGVLGSGAGVGLNALYNIARGEDWDENSTKPMLYGGLIGSQLGSALGAGMGQRFSQDRDFDYQVVR